MPRKNQSEGIIFAITGIWELYLSQQRCEEGTRCSETVDTQSIVWTVLVCPLLMIDKSRGEGIQLEVAHAVRTYHHSSILLIEGIYYLLKGLG